MKTARTIRLARTEAGIALLISIFVLLLISVVAIALIVTSGTETSLAGNYRSSTGVYYAALSGIEEARGRLSAHNPNSFKTTWASFYPAPGSTLPIGTVGYVLNPGPTDPADPRTVYPDTEYDAEFGAGALAAATSAGTVKTTLSIWNKTPLTTNLSFPGPLYKWVRINAVSELSLKLADSYPFIDGSQDPTPLYYDGQHLTDTNPLGQLPQVFELTALAVLPNSSGQSSQKLVQYLVAPTPIPLPPFLAALTLSDSAGNPATFHAPASNGSYVVKGDDYDCSGNPTANKNAAIGVFVGTPTSPDITSVKSGIPSITYAPSPPSTVPQNYTGSGAAPDVENIGVSFPANLQIPSNLDALAQTIIQNADVVITPASSTIPPYTATGSALTPLGMTSSNPLTVVVNGNLDISNWSNDGYGLLLVTGTFTYDPDTIWDGIILVIGQGIVNGSHSQYKQINGAMLVAKTRNASANPSTAPVLAGPNLGGASVVFQDSMQGYGIRYSNCWIQQATPTGNYKILSFHEISQ